jgi:hypothetical protein
MISAPSAQIVNAIAERTIVHTPSGVPVNAYGPTMAISTAIVIVGIIITISLGPERRGREFEHSVTGLDIQGREAVIDKHQETRVENA